MKKEEALQLMLNKARTANDPTTAECWILTAKTLGASYDVDVKQLQTILLTQFIFFLTLCILAYWISHSM